jgi:hypothetical protein
MGLAVVHARDHMDVNVFLDHVRGERRQTITVMRHAR